MENITLENVYDLLSDTNEKVTKLIHLLQKKEDESISEDIIFQPERKMTKEVIQSFFTEDQLSSFRDADLSIILGKGQKDNPLRVVLNHVFRSIYENFYPKHQYLQIHSKLEIQKNKKLESSMRLTAMKIADVLSQNGCRAINVENIYQIFRKNFMNSLSHNGIICFLLVSNFPSFLEKRQLTSPEVGETKKMRSFSEYDIPEFHNDELSNPGQATDDFQSTSSPQPQAIDPENITPPTTPVVCLSLFVSHFTDSANNWSEWFHSKSSESNNGLLSILLLFFTLS
jgi:hypothetical protein